MKPKLFITALFISTTLFTSQAQYTKLVNFDGINNGSDPRGALISDGTFLYGMTQTGGADDQGVVFKMKQDGTGYTKLLDFNISNGAHPRGSLITDGNYLYGTAYDGGIINHLGLVFKIRTDGTSYTSLVEFNGGANGDGPRGSLIYDGTYLYGMTVSGGTTIDGVIFKIRIDGTGYAKLLDFDGSANGSGRGPLGSLIYDGIFLYGMTNYGGTNDHGVVFKIKPDSTGFTKLFDFNDIATGKYPLEASLIYDGTYLYGTTSQGGINDMGVIFKIRPDGTDFTKLLDFNGTNNGSTPRSGVILVKGFLYGTTYAGGANDMGVLFKIKPDGTDYSNLLDFKGVLNGGSPISGLVADNTYLYGMTSGGGAYGLGTVFKFQHCTAISNTFSITPADCGNNNGSVTANPSGGAGSFTYLWSNGDTTGMVAGLSGQPTDTLTVTITDSVGCTLIETAYISCLTGIHGNNLDMDFTVNPNPNNGKFMLEWERKSVVGSTVALYNVMGEKVYQTTISEQSSAINLNVPDGIYFIRILTEQGKTSRKVIINY